MFRARAGVILLCCDVMYICGQGPETLYASHTTKIQLCRLDDTTARSIKYFEIDETFCIRNNHGRTEDSWFSDTDSLRFDMVHALSAVSGRAHSSIGQTFALFRLFTTCTQLMEALGAYVTRFLIPRPYLASPRSIHQIWCSLIPGCYESKK